MTSFTNLSRSLIHGSTECSNQTIPCQAFSIRSYSSTRAAGALTSYRPTKSKPAHPFSYNLSHVDAVKFGIYIVIRVNNPAEKIDFIDNAVFLRTYVAQVL